MLPDVWGESVWNTMHLISAGYPDNPNEKDKQKYKCFYKYIGQVLPCNKCITHYKIIMKKYPIDKYLSERNKLMHWVYLVHNAVNRMLKKSIKISWRNVHKKYIRLRYFPLKVPKNVYLKKKYIK